MRLVPTRRCIYALRAIALLASRGDRLTCEELSDVLGVPQGPLHQVLRNLRRTGIVVAQPGSGGGYQLAPGAPARSVKEVLEAIDGALEPLVCVMSGAPCPASDVCSVHDSWIAGRIAFLASLEQMLLHQLGDPANLAIVPGWRRDSEH